MEKEKNTANIKKHGSEAAEVVDPSSTNELKSILKKLIASGEASFNRASLQGEAKISSLEHMILKDDPSKFTIRSSEAKEDSADNSTQENGEKTRVFPFHANPPIR